MNARSIGMDEREGEKLYDSAVLIGPDGGLLLRQRKIDNLQDLNLFDPPYEDGRPEEMRVVETPLGRIGIAICADAFEETLMRRMGVYSPDLLLVPVGWAAEKGRWPRHGEILARMMARTARWVGCPVVCTNCVGLITHGPWTGKIYGGQSVIVDGEGEPLRMLRDRDADVQVVEVMVGSRSAVASGR